MKKGAQAVTELGKYILIYFNNNVFGKFTFLSFVIQVPVNQART